jgi:hypothetical protein
MPAYRPITANRIPRFDSAANGYQYIDSKLEETLIGAFVATIAGTLSANRIYTLQDAPGTIALLEAAQTWTANQRINGLLGINAAPALNAITAGLSVTNLLLNGDFADTSAWTASGATWAVSGNKATVTETSVGQLSGQLRQSITTVVGTRYRLTVTFYGTLSSNLTAENIRAATTAGGSDLGITSKGTFGGTDITFVLDFVATGTTSHITLLAASTAAVVGVSVWGSASVVEVSSAGVAFPGRALFGGATVDNQMLADFGVPTTTVLTSNKDKAVRVSGQGAAYFLGKDTLNGIEFVFGVSSAGTGFVGTLTNHDVRFVAGNSTKAQLIQATGNWLFGPSTTTDGMTAGGSVAIAQDFAHRGTLFGAFSATPVAQRGAYTQTYSTATRTVPDATASTVTDSNGTYGFAAAADRTALVTQINNLQADVLELKKLINSLIDDSQALGYAT